MLASMAEPMEQREPSSLLEWPSRDRGRRSQREQFRRSQFNIRLSQYVKERFLYSRLLVSFQY